jgi:hypothetical protein
MKRIISLVVAFSFLLLAVAQPVSAEPDAKPALKYGDTEAFPAWQRQVMSEATADLNELFQGVNSTLYTAGVKHAMLNMCLLKRLRKAKEAGEVHMLDIAVMAVVTGCVELTHSETLLGEGKYSAHDVRANMDMAKAYYTVAYKADQEAKATEPADLNAEELAKLNKARKFIQQKVNEFGGIYHRLDDKLKKLEEGAEKAPEQQPKQGEGF